MSNIIKRRIGDIVTFKRGYDLPASMRTNGIYPVISSSGVSGFHDKYKKDGEGVITGRYGTLGEVYYVNGNYWPHNTTLYVTNFHGNYPKYVFYLLKCLGNLATSDKSTVPGINRNDLHELVVPFQEHHDTQQNIAAVLSALDDKIELNNKINAELEAMAKLIHDYWFVQFDFPDVDGKPYKASGGKMVYDEKLKRDVPEGWKVKSLYDVAEYINGLACQKYRPLSHESPYLPVIKIREMSDGISPNTERVKLDIPDKYIINDGNVLFSWSATLDIKIWCEGKAGLNQHIFKVVSDLYPRSFYFFEISNYLRHFKMMADLRKTTMGHITIDHLKESRITIPPLPIIDKLDKILDPMFAAIISNRKQSQELARLRNWLLPLLMNGQVTVKEAYEQVEDVISVAAEGEHAYNIK